MQAFSGGEVRICLSMHVARPPAPASAVLALHALNRESKLETLHSLRTQARARGSAEGGTFWHKHIPERDCGGLKCSFVGRARARYFFESGSDLAESVPLPHGARL